MKTDQKVTHTPGPWAIYDGGADDNLRVETNGKGGVCKVARKGVDNREIEKANAQLIAAAPELLHELKEMVRVLENGWKVDREIYLENAKTVIRKAEGLG